MLSVLLHVGSWLDQHLSVHTYISHNPQHFSPTMCILLSSAISSSILTKAIQVRKWRREGTRFKSLIYLMIAIDPASPATFFVKPSALFLFKCHLHSALPTHLLAPLIHTLGKITATGKFKILNFWKTIEATKSSRMNMNCMWVICLSFARSWTS